MKNWLKSFWPLICRFYFWGMAAPLHQEYLKETLRVPVLFAPAHAARQRAGALAARAVLLMEEGRAVNAEEFAPEYLRPSQAERVRAERKRQSGMAELVIRKCVWRTLPQVACLEKEAFPGLVQPGTEGSLVRPE